MNWLAWTVFIAFLIYVVADGVRRGSGAHDLDDYYAGGRQVPWWAAGLSVMATQLSAITIVGTTGQGHEGGMAFLQTYLGLPFAMIILCIVMIPLLRRYPILTAYEYLERRFNPATRSLASLIFLISRCAALGVVIYGPAVVLSAITGLGVNITVIIMGILTTFYTVWGGINAVVWTDVKQMSVILVGLIIVLVILFWEITRELNIAQALTVIGAAGKLNALEVIPESTELIPRAAGSFAGAPSFWEQRYNLWSGLIGGLFLMLAYFGCDQSQVQRILTNPTANESRKALLLSAFTKVPLQFGVLLIGVLLWLFHALHTGPLLFKPDDLGRARAPENAVLFADLEQRYQAVWEEQRAAMLELAALDGDPRGNPELVERYQTAVRQASEIRKETLVLFGDPGTKDDTNYIFPHFIIHHLHPLLLGLIMAAIFAAAMSSVDSLLNSLSAATIVDFYKRWLRPDAEATESLRAGRTATLAWGAAGTFAALFFVGGGSIIEQINRVGSFFYGSLLGVFTLGALVPRTRGWAGFVGLLGGMACVMVVHLTLKVEFLWYNVVGCFGVLVVGAAAALLTPHATEAR